MVKFCRVCGYTLEEGATTCSACGAAVTPEAAPAGSASQTVNKDLLKKIFGVVNTVLLVVERLLRLGVGKIAQLINNSGKK